MSALSSRVRTTASAPSDAWPTPGRRLADDLEVRLGTEDLGPASADEGVIIGDYHAGELRWAHVAGSGHRSSTSVPQPGAERISSRPPIAAVRRRMTSTPK